MLRTLVFNPVQASGIFIDYLLTCVPDEMISYGNSGPKTLSSLRDSNPETLEHKTVTIANTPRRIFVPTQLTAVNGEIILDKSRYGITRGTML